MGKYNNSSLKSKGKTQTPSSFLLENIERIVSEVKLPFPQDPKALQVVLTKYLSNLQRKLFGLKINLSLRASVVVVIFLIMIEQIGKSYLSFEVPQPILITLTTIAFPLIMVGIREATNPSPEKRQLILNVTTEIDMIAVALAKITPDYNMDFLPKPQKLEQKSVSSKTTTRIPRPKFARQPLRRRGTAEHGPWFAKFSAPTYKDLIVLLSQVGELIKMTKKTQTATIVEISSSDEESDANDAKSTQVKKSQPKSRAKRNKEKRKSVEESKHKLPKEVVINTTDNKSSSVSSAVLSEPTYASFSPTSLSIDTSSSSDALEEKSPVNVASVSAISSTTLLCDSKHSMPSSISSTSSLTDSGPSRTPESLSTSITSSMSSLTTPATTVVADDGPNPKVKKDEKINPKLDPAFLLKQLKKQKKQTKGLKKRVQMNEKRRKDLERTVEIERRYGEHLQQRATAAECQLAQTAADAVHYSQRALIAEGQVSALLTPVVFFAPPPLPLAAVQPQPIVPDGGPLPADSKDAPLSQPPK